MDCKDDTMDILMGEIMQLNNLIVDYKKMLLYIYIYMRVRGFIIVEVRISQWIYGSWSFALKIVNGIFRCKEEMLKTSKAR